MIRSLLADADAERLPAALALRQRPEHDHGRRLGRPDHRLRRGLRRRRLRPRRGAGGDGRGRRREPAAAPTANTSSARAWPSTWPSATSPSTSTPTSATPTRSTAAPNDVWGSAATTLEYAVDDFAIAQFAARSLARPRHLPRLHAALRATGASLYDPASGMIEPRYANGAFPSPYDNLDGGGFVEGDSAQYTWMVPQDPAGLFRAMGGRAKARGAARPLPARAQRRPRRHPHRPRPARQRADPADALALRLDAAALPHPGGGPPRASASTARRPTATPATTTSARSRPGTCSAPSASTRRCPASACWRSAARSSGAPRSPCRTAAG